MRQWIFMVFGCLLLSGCFDDVSDIKQFMDQVAKNYPPQIEAIPAVREFAHIKYTGAEQRSPFAKPKAEAIQDRLAQLQDCLQPDRNRAKEPLEKYALANLKMKGTMGYAKDPWALIESSTDGSLHRVAVGSYMGMFHGKITVVKDDQIEIVEMVPDGTGCWIHRTTVVDMMKSEDLGKNNE